MYQADGPEVFYLLGPRPLGEEGVVGIAHHFESTTVKAGEQVKGRHDVHLNDALVGNEVISGETIQIEAFVQCHTPNHCSHLVLGEHSINVLEFHRWGSRVGQV
jgi:hypothetical protein